MKVFIAHSARDSDLAASLATLLRRSGDQVSVTAEIVTGDNLWTCEFISSSLR